MIRPSSATSIEISEILETESTNLDYHTSKLNSPHKHSILQKSFQVFFNNLKFVLLFGSYLNSRDSCATFYSCIFASLNVEIMHLQNSHINHKAFSKLDVCCPVEKLL